MKVFIFFAISLLLSACVHNYYIKENLSPNQIVETAIIRKPSLVKSRIILPRYDDYLEGYISGKIMTGDGKPLQGIIVGVQDKKEKEYPGFVAGVSNSSGIYKVRFSQPIIWKRVDIEGFLTFGSGWRALNRKTKFRLYFNRNSGDLAYTPEENVLILKNEEIKNSNQRPAPPPTKKPSMFSPLDSQAPSAAPAPGAPPPASEDPFADFDL